eukprot:COSAG05_NODE_1645_length_4351_cov_17.986595_2_plen_154_part_00
MGAYTGELLYESDATTVAAGSGGDSGSGMGAAMLRQTDVLRKRSSPDAGLSQSSSSGKRRRTSTHSAGTGAHYAGTSHGKKPDQQFDHNDASRARQRASRANNRGAAAASAGASGSGGRQRRQRAENVSQEEEEADSGEESGDLTQPRKRRGV